MSKKIKYILILFVLLIISVLFVKSNSSPLQPEISQEVQAMPLSIEGSFPKWLNGVLVRNSSIPIYKEGTCLTHLFDGIAMLHSFSFDQGNVSYTNRFLLSDAYNSMINQNNANYDGFASTQPLWQNVCNFFVDSSKWVRNASVNVFKYGNAYVALTEVPGPAQFDLRMLETQGTFTFHDSLPKSRCFESAHPHLDFTSKEIFNYLIEFGRKSHYVLYNMEEGSSTRKVIAKIPVELPAYMHSFAMTEHYLILTEFPLVVKPLDLVTTNKPYIHNFKWIPEQGTRFLVIEKSTGKLVSQATTDSFFSWHHANAFESTNRNDLTIDLIAFPDLSRMTEIFPQTSTITNRASWTIRLMRYKYSLDKHEISSEILLEKIMEFPRIDDRLDGKPYRYLYFTLSNAVNETRMNELGKFDLETKQLITWNDPGYQVMEPIFVPSPESQSEDEGVILSVIHDIKKNSFLIALDGKTFKEIARAKMPWHIPSSFHGQFFSDSSFIAKEHIP